MLLRYAENSFKRTWVTTIGIDYKFRYLDIKGKRVRLEIWDTAGQERFRTITTSYIRGAEGVMLCYDVTNRESFKAVDNWMKEIDKSAGSSRLGIQKFLVGNKIDVAARVVPEDEGRAMASTYGMHFKQTSAKTGENVEDAFRELAEMILDQKEKAATAGEAGPATTNLKGGDGKPAGGGCAC